MAHHVSRGWSRSDLTLWRTRCHHHVNVVDHRLLNGHGGVDTFFWHPNVWKSRCRWKEPCATRWGRHEGYQTVIVGLDLTSYLCNEGIRKVKGFSANYFGAGESRKCFRLPLTFFLSFPPSSLLCTVGSFDFAWWMLNVDLIRPCLLVIPPWLRRNWRNPKERHRFRWGGSRTYSISQ